MGVSLREFSQSSLIDDIDIEVIRARFVLYDFEGKSDGEKTCLCLTMKDLDGNEHPSYYSAGDPQYFVPSEDPKNEDLNGIDLVAVGEKKIINGSTNCAVFITSLFNAGFPEDLMEQGDVRVLEGLKAHVNRVAQPKRNNLPKKDGQKADPTVLVVTSILALPGESKPVTKTAAKTAATTKPNGAAKPAAKATAQTASPSSGAEVDQDLLTELTGEIIGLFAEKGATEMKRVDITKGLFSSIDKTNPNRNKLIQLAGQEPYLKAIEGFTFDGSKLSQAE